MYATCVTPVVQAKPQKIPSAQRKPTSYFFSSKNSKNNIYITSLPPLAPPFPQSIVQHRAGDVRNTSCRPYIN